jgi:hypothetical protein
MVGSFEAFARLHFVGCGQPSALPSAVEERSTRHRICRFDGPKGVADRVAVVVDGQEENHLAHNVPLGLRKHSGGIGDLRDW